MARRPLTPRPPMPALAAMAPCGRMPHRGLPALAPMPPMPPMAPMPPVALLDDDDMVAPRLFAMAFEPQDDEARERERHLRELAQSARELARAQTRSRSGEDTEYRRGPAALHLRHSDNPLDFLHQSAASNGGRPDC